MDQEKNRVRVSIFGEEYVVKGSASPDDLLELATYVDERMRALSRHNPRLGTMKLAVLTAMNLADEVFRLRKAGKASRPDAAISETAAAGESPAAAGPEEDQDGGAGEPTASASSAENLSLAGNKSPSLTDGRFDF